LEQCNKLIARYVDKLTSAYPTRSAVAKVHETNQKLNVPTHHSWYRLGTAGTATPMFSPPIKQTGLPFEDNPAVASLYATQAAQSLWQQEAMSVIERVNGPIEGTYSDLIQTRRYLRYMPAK
jgi:hypothetical protein